LNSPIILVNETIYYSNNDLVLSYEAEYSFQSLSLATSEALTLASNFLNKLTTLYKAEVETVVG